MKINDSVQIYNLVNKHADKIDRLTPEERETVLVALKNIELLPTTASSVVSLDYKRIEQSLTKTEVKSDWFSWLKDILTNIAHFGSRPAKIKDELKSIASRKQELRTIQRQIKEKKEKLADWIEMVRFAKEEALPLYEESVGFFKSLLPKDPSAFNMISAKIRIRQKIKEVKEKIEELKQTPTYKTYRGGLYYIYERELLVALTALEKYKGTNKTEVKPEEKKGEVKPKVKPEEKKAELTPEEKFARVIKLSTPPWENAVRGARNDQESVKQILLQKDQIRALEKREKDIKDTTSIEAV